MKSVDWTLVLDSNFLGALIGALLSGLIAIYVLRKDIKFRKEEKQTESNNNFKKAYQLLAMWANSYLGTLQALDEEIKNDSVTKKEQISINLEALKECKYRLDNINDDYIPHNVYKDFLELKVLVDLTLEEYSAYESTIQAIYADDRLYAIHDNHPIKHFLIDNYDEKRSKFELKLSSIREYYRTLKF